MKSMHVSVMLMGNGGQQKEHWGSTGMIPNFMLRSQKPLSSVLSSSKIV